MAFKDLHEFVAVLENKGLLHRVTTLVDPVLEITEITDRISKKGGPALLFERVKGSPYPVLINAFGSFERMSLALGVQQLDEIGARISKMLELQDLTGSLLDKMKFLPRLAEMGSGARISGSTVRKDFRMRCHIEYFPYTQMARWGHITAISFYRIRKQWAHWECTAFRFLMAKPLECTPCT